MAMLDILASGLTALLDPFNALTAILGLGLGIVFGALPGLNAIIGVALVLPFTFSLSPVAALSLLIGMYKGGVFAGSIPAILLNVPGAPESSATMDDGFALTRAGKSGKALGASLYGSFTGSLIGDIILILLAAPLSAVALRFGPTELFALFAFSMIIIGAISAGGLLKGLAAAVLGLLVSTIGMDAMTGVSRFSFGHIELTAGIPFLALLMGIFAITEVLIQIERSGQSDDKAPAASPDVAPGDSRKMLSLSEMITLAPSVLRSSLLGAFIGAIPGPGATTSAFASYALAKQLSKTPDRFGKGALEGIAAPDSGNNSTCSATLIPLFALGVPGAPVAAVFAGALMIHGITPGPAMLSSNPSLVGAFLIMFVASSLLLLPVGYAAIRSAMLLLRLPKSLLYMIVLILSFAGVYANSSSTFDLVLMSIFGVLGYVMRKTGLPASAFVVAYVIGGPMESAFKRAMLMNGGDATALVRSPIAAALFLLAAATIAAMFWKNRQARRQTPAGSS